MARTYTNIIAALNFSLEPFCKRLLYWWPPGVVANSNNVAADPDSSEFVSNVKFILR